MFSLAVGKASSELSESPLRSGDATSAAPPDLPNGFPFIALATDQPSTFETSQRARRRHRVLQSNFAGTCFFYSGFDFLGFRRVDRFGKRPFFLSDLESNPEPSPPTRFSFGSLIKNDPELTERSSEVSEQTKQTNAEAALASSFCVFLHRGGMENRKHFFCSPSFDSVRFATARGESSCFDGAPQKGSVHARVENKWKKFFFVFCTKSNSICARIFDGDKIIPG
jgi:hypothetical protein